MPSFTFFWFEFFEPKQNVLRTNTEIKLKGNNNAGFILVPHSNNTIRYQK